jgi:large subunit ribosomal protein L4
VSNRLFSLAIRCLRNNWRQGTVGFKSRGEVALSSRKPWKQKGTGRARAGTPRSPLWRKGGVIFGPEKRVRQLRINAKQRKLVMNGICGDFISAGKIFAFDDSGGRFEKPSCSAARALLLGGGELPLLVDKKVLLFVDRSAENIILSFRGLSNVNMLFFDEPNAYDMVNADMWLFPKSQTEKFIEMVERWN